MFKPSQNLVSKIILPTIVAVSLFTGCSKNSSGSSTAQSATGGTNTGASVDQPVNGINPALKAYANSVNSTGLFNGTVLSVNLDIISQSLNVQLTLPTMFAGPASSIPATLFRKYPEINYSTSMNANGRTVVSLSIPFQTAKKIYKNWQASSGTTVPVSPTNPSVPVSPSNPNTTIGCTGRYSGSVDMPDHDVRIANRNRALEEKGIAVTGNDDIDNAGTGGGAPDGGIWLAGAFEFVTGPMVNGACPIISANFVIHGWNIAASGSVNSDKTFSFWHEGGPVTGSVDNNNHITGRFAEGGGREWVYGNLNGTFVPQ